MVLWTFLKFIVYMRQGQGVSSELVPLVPVFIMMPFLELLFYFQLSLIFPTLDIG